MDIPEVELTSASLMRAAEAESGLSDWGPNHYFEEPLRIYLAAVEATGNFHALGRFVLWRTAVRLLANRLRLQRDYTKYPDILATAIPKPLFILGLPRTGTTLLHNLLALDPQARSIPLWQGLFPSPPPNATTAAEDPRIAMTHEHVAMVNQIAPRLAMAHALEPTGPEECLWLMEHSFADLIFDLRADVPDYAAWLGAHRQDTEPYLEYRQIVQVLAWQQGGTHWVFKAPRHLLSLATLIEVFPEAKIVQTHRNPEEVIPSICSLGEISRGIFTANPDKAAIGRFALDRLGGGITKAMAVREDDFSERYVDIDYRTLVADPIASVRKIYETHGYAYSKVFEETMKEWLNSNRQHKHGKHHYQLEDYDLTRSEVNECFADYRKRFAV